MRKNHYTMIARSLIREAIDGFGVDSSDHLGIGVSGGADSSALLIGISKLYRAERASQIHVLIVDHQLQEETANVSRTVADHAVSLGFTAHILPVNISETSKGAEYDARISRYEAFEAIRESENLKAILLGHTKSDQAEQVFLGLLRGSGTRSLAGIRAVRDHYLRPFLNGLDRSGTESVCVENEYSYWSDPHNDLTKYRRVSIRQMISTVEKETGQSIVDPLVRTAKISSEDADALDYFTELNFEIAEETRWSTKFLEGLPVAIRKRLYRKKMLTLGAPTDSLIFELVERIDLFLTDWKGQGEVCFSGNHRVGRAESRIFFE